MAFANGFPVFDVTWRIMSDQTVTHRFIPNCSKGIHNWKLVFRNNDKILAWVKICRRCDKVKSVTGSFDEEGEWVKRKQTEYGKAGDE